MTDRPTEDRYAWWRELRVSSVSATARHVALAISTYMDAGGGNAHPSMVTLANDTGRSRRTVARAVDELLRAGLLEVSSGGGRREDGGYFSNRYRASFPAPTNGAMGGNVATGDTDGSGTNGPSNGDTDGNGAWGGTAPTVSSDDGTVSSEHLAVSSGHGAVSPMTANGVTHGTRSTQEVPIQQPSQPTTLPDGWTDGHPSMNVYAQILNLLKRKLGDQAWDVLRAEPDRHVQRLRNAAATAAEHNVDPHRLIPAVTAKSLEGVSSIAAVIAKRLEDATPSFAGTYARGEVPA